MRGAMILSLLLVLAPHLSAQAPGPAPRIYHSMVPLDHELGHIVITGVTRHGWTMDLADAWSLRGLDAVWRRMADLPPGEFYAAAYDAESRRIVTLSLSGETWALDPVADRWERRSPSASPEGRCGQRMTYDPGIDRVVLFGGFPCTAETLQDPWMNDTWVYDYNEDRWEERKPRRSPPGRIYHAQAFDPALGRVVAWGGRVDDLAVWSYDFPGNTWVEHAIAGGPGSMLAYQGMAYEPGLGALLVFGGLYLEGSRVATGTLSGETWVLDVEAGTWRALSPGRSPAPRSHHTLVLDPGSGRVIAFGGELEAAYSGIMSDELWAFDPSSITWVRIAKN